MNKRLLFLSFAVLFCGLFAFADKPVNVADKYMENYLDPYYYVNKTTADGDTVTEFLTNDEVLKFDPTVNFRLGAGTDSYEVTVPRYHVIGAPWKTEGMLGTLGTDATCWHVDLQKGRQNRIKGTLTITSGWGDFAHTFDNMKVYQTTKQEVPAGKYDLKANWGQDRTGAKYTFLVLTKGNTIPDTTALATDPNVIGYVKLSDSLNIPFTLDKPMKLTFGFVASFPEHENPDQGYCSAMGDFELIKWVKGTNYTELNQVINQLKSVTNAQFPIGLTPGKYPQAKWDAFQAALEAGKDIIANIPAGDPLDPNYKDKATQQQVDDAVKAIKDAYEALKASIFLPFKYSTDTKSFYYRVVDMRGTPNYWKMGEDFLEDGITPVDRLMLAQEVDEADERMMFKFVKDTKVEGNAFYIYCKALQENALSVNPDKANLIVSQQGGKDTTWTLVASQAPNADKRFVVRLASENRQLNSYHNAGYVGFYNSLTDVGNAWRFDRVYMQGETNFSKLNDAINEAAEMTPEKYPVGTGLAQFSKAAWDAFVAAKEAAEKVLAKEFDTPQPSQTDVDNATKTLTDAMAALEASMTDPIVFSTDTEEKYYIVHDKRAEKNYWQIAEGDINGTPVPRLKLSKTATNDDDSFRFKFVKKDAASKDFYIYSKTDKTTALSVSPDDKNFIQINSIIDSETWTLGRTPVKDPDYFVVTRATAVTDDNGNEVYQQMNSYATSGFVGFWQPASDDPGNDWKFIEEVESGVKTVGVTELGIFVKDRRILSTDNAQINVYSISGQKLNSKHEMAPGIYIVTVDGKQGAAKVIIR